MQKDITVKEIQKSTIIQQLEPVLNFDTHSCIQNPVKHL